MTLAHLARVIQDQRTGRLVLGATVTLCNPGTSAPISEQLYADPDLTLPMPNPFISASGIIDVYLADPKTVLLLVQYGSNTDSLDNLQIIALAENIVVTPVPFDIANGPGTATVLIGIDAGNVHWATLSDVYASTDDVLLGWFLTEAYQFTSITRDSNGAMVSASLQWPDSTPGVYTADSVSTIFPGKVDAWNVTYDNGVTTKTFTQADVTRDDNGDITVMPLVVIT